MDQRKPAEGLLEDESLGKEIGVCKTDNEFRVIFQNTACQKICGNRLGKICNGPCVQKMKFHNPHKTPGTFQFKAENVLEGLYDILVLKSKDYSTMILFDLEEKQNEIKEGLKSYGLTHRELEIADLASQNLSNTEIANRLYISPKTLKTHINNILKKMPRHLWREVSDRDKF